MTREEVEVTIKEIEAETAKPVGAGMRRGLFVAANLLREALAKSETATECDALCPPQGLSEGQRCHLRGPHEAHEAPGGTSWPDHMTERRAKVTP